jgi:hypothetical protein
MDDSAAFTFFSRLPISSVRLVALEKTARRIVDRDGAVVLETYVASPDALAALVFGHKRCAANGVS